jgi:cyclomaltodextrinase / maltogenic alpha-amylase / neopullulanase
MDTTRSSEPEWVQDAIWWHVYPLGFVGAEASPEPGQEVAHRLGHLVGWLDHAVELGLSGIALGPVFASQTHGYDTTDHLRIDPRLGDDDDFDALVAGCRERGLRLLLDGVFNHVGREHPAFQAVLEHGPQAETASWFRLRWPGGADAWQPGTEPDYDDFEGHRHLVALDTGSPEVLDHLTEVMVHWLDRGADGWRLDAAYAVPTRTWAELARRVRERHPAAYLMGELIQGDYPSFVREAGIDAVTQYELWKGIWSSLNDTNLFELESALGRHNTFLEEFVPYTFVGNHDVTRIASRLQDVALLEHALVVLFTVGGTPSVYAGDELAFRGTKEEREGGDDAVRPQFPDTPADLTGDGQETFRLHQELVGLRRRHRWLHGASTTTLHLTNEQLAYEVSAEGQRLVVVLSLETDEVEVPAARAGELLAGDADVLDAGTDDARVRLRPRGWAVLSG